MANQSPGRLKTLCLLLLLDVGLAACGSNSPTSPTVSVSSVSLNGTSVVAGSQVQGTITLSSAAPVGGVIVALSSSNSAVAAVPTTVTIPAGGSSGTIQVTAVTPGTVTITASLSGTSTQSSTLTVTAVTIVSSLSLSASTVVGGNPVSATVTLSAPAPTSGVLVSLSGGDPLNVATSVTVPAGSSSATFSITTRIVVATMSATVTATYNGVSVLATLSVTPVPPPMQAIASFGVTGPSETETCVLTNGGNTINCTFNGSTSTAPGTIVGWEWTYGVAKAFTQTTAGPVLTMPTADCTIIPAALPPGTTWFSMSVKLVVRDNLGNVSEPSIHTGTRLFPQGVCGF